MFLLFIIISFQVNAQVVEEDAWVYLAPKTNTQTYINNPLLMLSQRAIDRRIKQNIAIDDTDVPIQESIIDLIENQPGITVFAKSKWLNALHIQGEVTDIQNLLTLPEVQQLVFADPALNNTTSKKVILKPKIAQIAKTTITEISYNYGNSLNQIEMLGGTTLHQQDYTGDGIQIAIMDSGFIGVDTTSPFEKLRTENRILGGYNFVNQDSNLYTNHNHGTSVLSTMAGYVSGQLIGTAPQASYYLFVTEDVNIESPLEESYWVEAAEMADQLGVDVINTSLGYFDGFTNQNYDHSYSDMDGNTTFISRGANIAFSKGMLVVASAGNNGNSEEPHIGSPADATHVIAVGAVDAAENRAYFSSVGPSYDGRVKPDVMAKGLYSTLALDNGSISTSSGTSFSGPILCGMTACLWQAFPDKTNQEIKDIILQSADRYNAPTSLYGYGIPDFSAALTTLNSELNVEYPQILYPSFVIDSIHFEIQQPFENASVMIFSSSGQIVFDKNGIASTEIISLETLPSGVYFYYVITENSQYKGKIIKF